MNNQVNYNLFSPGRSGGSCSGGTALSPRTAVTETSHHPQLDRGDGARSGAERLARRCPRRFAGGWCRSENASRPRLLLPLLPAGTSGCGWSGAQPCSRRPLAPGLAPFPLAAKALAAAEAGGAGRPGVPGGGSGEPGGGSRPPGSARSVDWIAAAAR